jgi:hypothetical protein
MNFCMIVAFKAVVHSQSLVKGLPAMQFRLRAMLHSAEFFFPPRIADELRAVQSNLISIENIFNKHSALCCIVRSRLSAMLYSGESSLRTMQQRGSHDSTLCSIAHIRKYLREFETEFENILGYYAGA